MLLKIGKGLKTALPFLLGVVVLAILLLINDAPQNFARIRFDPLFFLSAVFINMVLYGIFARRWHLLLLEIASDTPIMWSQCLFYYVTAAVLGVFMPSSAALLSVGIGSLDRFHHISLKKSTTSILLEKSFDIFPIIISFPSTLLVLSESISIHQAILLLVFMLLLISVIFYLAVDKLRHIDHPLVKRVLGSQLEISKRTLLHIYLLTLLTMLVHLLRVWFIAESIGIDIAIPVAVMGMAGNHVSSLISVTPSGLGVKEGAFYLAFRAAGLLTEQINAYMVAYRALTTVFLIFSWFPLYYLWLLGKRGFRLSFFAHE